MRASPIAPTSCVSWSIPPVRRRGRLRGGCAHRPRRGVLSGAELVPAHQPVREQGRSLPLSAGPRRRRRALADHGGRGHRSLVVRRSSRQPGRWLMARTIDVGRAASCRGGAQLVEVLPARSMRNCTSPGAINMPLKELDARAASGSTVAPVVVYCWDALCDMSPRAAAGSSSSASTPTTMRSARSTGWRTACRCRAPPPASQPPARSCAMTRDLHARDPAGEIRQRIDESPYGYRDRARRSDRAWADSPLGAQDAPPRRGPRS